MGGTRPGPWLALLLATAVLPAGAIKKLKTGKLFERMVEARSVLEAPLMVVWDCPETRVTDEIIDKVINLRKRIRIYKASESSNSLGKKLAVDTSSCMTVVLFPKWLTIDEAIAQRAYQMRTKQSAMNFQDWAWETLSEKAQAQMHNKAGENATISWVHVVTHEPVYQIELAHGKKTSMQTYVGHQFLFQTATRNVTFTVTDASMHFEMGETKDKDVNRAFQNANNDGSGIEVKIKHKKKKKKLRNRMHQHKSSSEELDEIPDYKNFKPEKAKGLSGATWRIIYVAIIALGTAALVSCILIVGYFSTKKWVDNAQKKKEGGVSHSSAAFAHSRVPRVPSGGALGAAAKFKKMMKRNID